MDVCDVKGRGCIENSYSKKFNCSTTCVGTYADIIWQGNEVYDEMEDEEAAASEGYSVHSFDGELKNQPEATSVRLLLKRVADLEKEDESP